MTISKREAERKAKEAVKKGYSIKLRPDYLIIIAGSVRTRYEIK